MNRKVIILGPAYPLRGGIANFNEALYRAYEEAGADVEIVSFSLQYPSVLFPGKSQKESDSRENPGLKITSLVNSVNPLSWMRAARYINQKMPDYVVVRFWLPFMAMSLGSIMRLLNKKIVVIALVDNAIPHEPRMGDKPLTRYFMKKPDGFVAMSKSVLADVEEITGSRQLRFVPHPVYDIYGDALAKKEARKSLKIDSQEKVLLFFGFIRKYKGLNLLLDALSDNRLKRMNVKLMIAGEFYDDPAPYHQKIEQLNLQHRVLLHSEFIPAGEIARYFCAADMVVQTYLSATQSGVTQIAYHFGRPMLVTDVGGLSEIVPHGEVGYVTDVDAVAVADALVDFYENSREEEMAANAKIKSGSFTWQALVSAFEELYTEQNR